jgi:threonine synthase
MYKIVDYKSRAEVHPSNLVFTGADAPWEVVMDMDMTRARINEDYFRASPPLVSKYLPFLPVKDQSNFVSLKEGGTPLIRSKRISRKLGLDLWFKLEPQNPTGSFKDRGSAVDLTVAREMGAEAIVLASTGNMAASCACYAAAAGIPCFVFVPEDTPASKLAQVMSYGGHIVQVKGRYNDAARVAQNVAEELGFYLAGDYAFRVEGQKTAAFEICDQFFFQVPDVVIVPIGCGTNLTAYFKGFKEYFELGLIDRMPQIIGVQATGSSAVVDAFRGGAADCTPLASIDTVASAIAVTYPIDGAKALRGIYESHGEAVAVTDKEMLQAQYELARNEAHFVEVSSAACLAAVIKLRETGKLIGKRVVCVLTGNGLKDPSPLLKVALKPPTIYPEVNEFLSLYSQSFFKGKTVAFFEPNEVLFSTVPSVADVGRYVEQFFSTTYPATYLEQIRSSVEKFLLKGKSVTFSDFQDIVQDAVRHLESRVEEVLTVEDFEIHTGKDRKPDARVVVRVRGEEREARATGVGPVDAVINALTQAGSGDTQPAALVGYKVEIRSQGTDAVVDVELKLRREGTLSVGNGISPDIIQASIEAFVSAFNNFYKFEGLN